MRSMLDLIASLPDAGFCHTPTAYAALDSPDSDRYYAGDQLTIVSNGDRATIPAAEYRSSPTRSRRAFPRQAQQLPRQALHGGFAGAPDGETRAVPPPPSG